MNQTTTTDAATILRDALIKARTALGHPDNIAEIDAALDAAERAAIQPAGDALYVECRECAECQHAGINDASDTLAACHDCCWSGDSPKEDKCPGCGCENCMTAACPGCGARYTLLAEATFAAPIPQQEKAEQVDAQRYQRLRILGAAPFGSNQLDNANVLRFQSLDGFIDADIFAHPSRGEFTPVAPAAHSEAGELPPLPEHDGRFNVNGPDGHRVKGWDEDSMREYGQLCRDTAPSSVTTAPATGSIGDDALVAAWFAKNDKYIVKADFDAWLEQAYRDGLNDARSPVAAAPEVASLRNAFMTLESSGGEGRTIVIKFNQRADAYSVHQFLLNVVAPTASTPPAPAKAEETLNIAANRAAAMAVYHGVGAEICREIAEAVRMAPAQAAQVGEVTDDLPIGAGDPMAFFADFCDRHGYPSDGDMDAALRGAFYEGIRYCAVHTPAPQRAENGGA